VRVEKDRPSCLVDARPLTERYWARCRLSGREVEELYLEWDRFRTAMLAFIASRDLILCPVAARPAPRHEEPAPWLFDYTLPFSLTGWPCVVVRAGTAADGLPIGVQLVGRAWREDVALAAAHVVEAALPDWPGPPL
jgi:amidase